MEKLQFWVRNVTGINLENHATLLLSIITVFLQFTITSVLKSNNGWILFYLKKQKETSFNTYEKKELEFQKFAFKIQYQTETKIHTFKWLIKYLNWQVIILIKQLIPIKLHAPGRSEAVLKHFKLLKSLNCQLPILHCFGNCITQKYTNAQWHRHTQINK